MENGKIIHTGGTHRKIHNILDKLLKDFTSGDEIEYKEARDFGIKSIKKTFPLSKCSKECLQKQLDSFYECDGDESCKGNAKKKLRYRKMRSHEINRSKS